jgi:hypothetical protein
VTRLFTIQSSCTSSFKHLLADYNNAAASSRGDSIVVGQSRKERELDFE